MVRISVMYPNSDGARFDVAYYKDKHMAMVHERLGGQGLVETMVEAGVAGGQPGEPPPFLCVGHLVFETLEGYQKAMRPHVKELMADTPNYTNVQPVVQVNEIVL